MQIKVDVDHSLGKEKAKLRIETEWNQQKKQVSGKIQDVRLSMWGDEWEFSGKAQGLQASGRLFFGETNLEIVLVLPVLAAPFRKQIEAAIVGELQRILQA